MVTRGELIRLRTSIVDALGVRVAQHTRERDRLRGLHRIAAANEKQQRAEEASHARDTVATMLDTFLAEHE